MKLIKQIKLYFKEGNSDKVYEVDLCDVGSEQYVVNFRFGRRGATLKEGTKTPKPVALLAAENYFNSLEVEKRKKGYQSEDEVFRPMPTGIVDDSKPQTCEAAILKRLSALASGQTAFRTAWKPSRVIWRAGQLRLIESVPFLIRLVDRGDEMQRYAALWSLGRCADPQAARTLQVYFSNQKYADKIRRVAGEALLHVLKDDELWAHTQRIESRLPPSVQQALAEPDVATLTTLLADSVQNQSQPDYSMLEDLYTLTLNKPIIRAPLLNVLRTIPLKPGWFRHVRHILKMAELRDDFEVQGLLAYRFERTTSFFRKPAYYHYDEDSNDPSIYIAALGQRVRIRAELRKPESRLAYSNRTRSYLRKRLFRTLIQFGKQKSVDYVRLATAILLSYDKATDYRPPHSEITYKWDQAQQRSILYTRQYPAYNNAYLLNWILYGGNDKLEIDYMGLWHYRELVPYDTQVQLDAQQAVKPMEGGLFASLLSRFSQLLGKQATDTTPEHADTPAPSVRDEYFPELWDQMPQAYVQLLLRARVDEVHAFAYQNLCQHAAYPAIDEKIDDQLLRQLLTSTFEIPARWGVELLRKRLPHGADRSLVLLLLNSPFADVRKLGQEWIEQNSQPFVDDSGFVVAMLFSPHDELRRWMNRLLANVTLTATQQQVLIGRAVARLHTLTDNTAETNALIGDATQSLLRYTADALPLLSQQVVAELLQLPVASIQAFAVRLLILKNSQPSASVLGALLTSAYADVRLAGQQLYAGMVSGLTTDATYADELTELLVHALIRKEVAEGIHDELAMVLRGPLVTSVAKLDRATTLRLVYAHFRPAQELGLFMLDRYQNPHDLTIRQIIALGNHELLAIRQWCWNYFRQNVARIRYERDEAIRLLDATWEDTRQAAMAFFRHAFTETDWTPETLIGIADSVRPDVQAFGRELITHFFTDADGPEFLLKLSQHPAAAVQVFTTNYLERYATDQPDRLKALAFYFRSVLLRVQQSRTAKTRVFAFLRQEGLKSEDNARFVARILTDVSATAAIGDKASCIQIMRDLQQQFNELPLPIRQHQLEIR
ncbi:WGR domain-containing protein [Spirosoma oryzae]|uniref:WGR domain-containing protein n=1 Tax=Spirosoma oryzae TaxID=1469603 RepID=A0A2T0TEK8_9BACT|nr:WGR domain-containing protein [Spirosoma oryzae]PRY44106.1 WGR domain-containing protein [Spirosoma oryzae]